MENQTVILALVAVLSLTAAIGHSWLGETHIFARLDGEGTGVMANRATRDVTRAVWHLPSVGWALLGLALFVTRESEAQAPLALVAIAFFAISGFGNLISLRRIHVGGIVLLTAAALTAFHLSQLIH